MKTTLLLCGLANLALAAGPLGWLSVPAAAACFTAAFVAVVCEVAADVARARKAK